MTFSLAWVTGRVILVFYICISIQYTLHEIPYLHNFLGGGWYLYPVLAILAHSSVEQFFGLEVCFGSSRINEEVPILVEKLN